MTGSFDVDPQAMQTASGAFADQSSALQSINDSTVDVQFQGGRAYYDPEGQGYQDAYRALVKNMVPPMVAKAADIGTALTQSSTSYTDQDTSASSGITTSGAGA